jgi:radical SAM superfamily enzyme YgiQ (UPF0313 family)
MKILLVYPGLVDGFDSFRKGSDWFNHGVGIIATVLRAAGHEVAYLDGRRLRGWAELTERIRAAPVEVALLSVATVDLEVSRRIARIVKAEHPAARVIVGGPHPTLMTEETAGFPEFDHVFTHEAEVTLPRVLADLASAPRVIHGEMPPDLDALPWVDRDLQPEGESPWFEGFERPYFAITASRGCLYQCTFCQPAERAMFGNKVRKRSVDGIIAELSALTAERGLRSFMIHDDCFTQYYRWVEEFCDKKAAAGLTQPFACQSRADIICKRPDLLKRLRDVGLRCVLIGFESGSDRVLEYLKKGVTVAENLEAARICRDLGIQIFANYMFGLPTETPDEMRATVRMIRQIKPDYHGAAVFTPAPGSALYAHCKEHDLTLIGSATSYRREAFSGAKIKGVDYGLVERLVAEAMGGKVLGFAKYLLIKAVQFNARRRQRRTDAAEG